MKNDPRSYDRNFCNCVKKPEKNSGLQRGLNPWPRDTGATLYQLSYEATDVGSRSILGSYVPVKDMKVNDAYEINHMWTADMKSNEEWSSQLWSGLEPVTSGHGFKPKKIARIILHSVDFISAVHIWFISYASFTLSIVGQDADSAVKQSELDPNMCDTP